MHLMPGRVAQMCAEADEANTAIICHSTLSGDNAVCRGYFDRRSSVTLRVAVAVDAIEWTELGTPIAAAVVSDAAAGAAGGASHAS